MNEEQELLAAIEGLYTVFAHYPLPSSENAACACCTSPEEVHELHAYPLRQIPPTVIARFGFKALSTWGDNDYFRHFLPRLLQTMALQTNALYPDYQNILGKLSYGNWYEWNAAEQTAIRNFLLAWWKYRLADYLSSGSGFILNDLLNSIALVEDDLQPYLVAWNEQIQNSWRAILNMVLFLDHNRAGVYANGYPDWIWTVPLDKMQQIGAFLNRPEFLPMAEETSLNFIEQNPAGQDLLSQLSEGLKVLEWLQYKCEQQTEG
jgi:hypothetical protein